MEQGESTRAAAAATGGSEGGPVALRRLLVGCDDSQGSGSAAAFALAVAGSAAAHVTLLHAGPDPDATPGHPEVAAAVAEQVREAERGWQRRLDAMQAQAPADAQVACRLERGSPGLALVQAARETGADLVLLGSGGVGHVRGALLGSVSSQVLQHAPCSVMLFSEQQPAPATGARTVLVALDGSDCSRYALRVAQGLATALAARLVLVHVVDPRIPFALHPPASLREQLLTAGRALLHEARASIVAPLEHVEAQLLEGGPRETLAAACEQHDPAVLVVGTRGLGGFKGLLIGSTSQWVVNHAPCPVLVAREPAGEDSAAG